MLFHAYLSGKNVRTSLPPSPNSMLFRESAVALVNPDQTQKKKHWLGAGVGGGAAVLSRRESVAFSRVLSKIVIYDKTEMANLPSGLISFIVFQKLLLHLPTRQRKRRLSSERVLWEEVWVHDVHSIYPASHFSSVFGVYHRHIQQDGCA